MRVNLEEFDDLIKPDQLAGHGVCRIFLFFVEDQVIVPFNLCNRRLSCFLKTRRSLSLRRKACRRYAFCISDVALESWSSSLRALGLCGANLPGFWLQVLIESI